MRERNFGFIFRVTVFICYCLCSSNCEEDGKNRQTFVIRYKDGEQTIPVTVVLDYKKQTEYVINMNPRTPAKSVTLYDFKQRTIAYKDLTNRECFLGRLTHETLSEESHALQDVKNPVEVRPKVRSLDPRKPALTPTEIRNIAGQKIAVFCRKMNTWILMPERTHGISKREASDIEERTYQYQGHRASQYSHYERETRRRYRNRNQANFRRRSQRKEGEANKESSRPSVPERSPFLPHLNTQSSNNIRFNPGHSDSITGASVQNNSSNYPTHQHLYPLTQRSEKENENREVSLGNRVPPRSSNINQNSFSYPNVETRASSSVKDTLSSKPDSNASLHNFNSNRTGEILVADHEIIPDFSKNTSNHIRKSKSLEKLILDDIHKVNETTTEIPYGQVGYPTVHSSLVHLLPLYKPLSQEFDFDQEARPPNHANNRPSNRQRNIESEGPLPTTVIQTDNRFTHFQHVHNTSHDSDVSVNVLEIPRITKEFENVKDNESYVSALQPQNTRDFHSSAESYPLLPGVHSGSTSYFQRNDLGGSIPRSEHPPLTPNININNNAKETTYFNRNNFPFPQPAIPATTEYPVLTTPAYFAERTTPNALYIPSVHTAFQNSEDFNSFQLFPNYIENSNNPIFVERNLSEHSTHGDKNKFAEENARRIPQHLVLTTEYSLTEVKHKGEANHRSDIPSEDNNKYSPSFNLVEAGVKRKSHPSVSNNTADENISSYKIRYQSALRDFKPDEIVIDIENIPTHTPPPVTSEFHRRIFTTIQPTIKSLSSNGIGSDTNRRSEQTSGSTWRNLYPTTRYPRRRINDKSRRPVQNSSVSPVQRGSLNQNRYQGPNPPAQINQLVGVNHFSLAHHTNRRQFHYPNRPIPPSHVRMPTEINQLHHISYLNDLPPGVSVHPRHPQAPFADMVHSNRPPTIPLSNENQPLLKHHRQRHHRKKDRLLNSCCRLRGQSVAFQSCCRNGGSCCSRSRRRNQLPGTSCCSSSNTIGQIIPTNQIQPPIRTTNKILPPIRTEKTHRSEVDNKDRCQKEKMCRTLYESTQQVMVCRNAHIEGC